MRPVECSLSISKLDLTSWELILTKRSLQVKCLAVSFKLKDNSIVAQTIAIVDVFDFYITSAKNVKDDEAVCAKPANAMKGLTRLGLDGGHDITWTRDGKKLFWFLGTFST